MYNVIIYKGNVDIESHHELDNSDHEDDGRYLEDQSQVSVTLDRSGQAPTQLDFDNWKKAVSEGGKVSILDSSMNDTVIEVKKWKQPKTRVAMSTSKPIITHPCFAPKPGISNGVFGEACLTESFREPSFDCPEEVRIVRTKYQNWLNRTLKKKKDVFKLTQEEFEAYQLASYLRVNWKVRPKEGQDPNIDRNKRCVGFTFQFQFWPGISVMCPACGVRLQPMIGEKARLNITNFRDHFTTRHTLSDNFTEVEVVGKIFDPKA